MNFATLLPFILKALSFAITKSNSSNEVKKKYFDLLQAIDEDSTSSVKLRASVKSQKERIFEQIDNQGTTP